MTVGHVARSIEAFRPNAQLIKPARVLSTPNIMGRPLGLPHRRDQQLAVIHSALRLLETADGAPTIETFAP